MYHTTTNLVVTNVRVEGSHQHKRLMEELVNTFLVCCNANNTVIDESMTAVPKQPNGPEERKIRCQKSILITQSTHINIRIEKIICEKMSKVEKKRNNSTRKFWCAR